jgi:hypothetical protein
MLFYCASLDALRDSNALHPFASGFGRRWGGAFMGDERRICQEIDTFQRSIQTVTSAGVVDLGSSYITIGIPSGRAYAADMACIGKTAPAGGFGPTASDVSRY